MSALQLEKGGKKFFLQNLLVLHRWYRRFESFISIGAAFTPIPLFLIMLFKNNEPAARVFKHCQYGVNEFSLMKQIHVLKLTMTHFFPPFWMATNLALLAVVPYVGRPSSASVALVRFCRVGILIGVHLLAISGV